MMMQTTHVIDCENCGWVDEAYCSECGDYGCIECGCGSCDE